MNDEMRIEQITLNNYRQYYGKVIVKFTTQENAFSIIIGDNGAGKSNLWNAIHWCLFKEEPHLKSTDKPPIINKKYLQEKSNGFIKTYVEIIMAKGRDKYLIKRSLIGQLEGLKKDDNGMIKLSKEDPVPEGFFIQDEDKSELFQVSSNGGEWETKNNNHNFKNLINKHIIPEELSKFFILDGEFLQDLFKEFKNIKTGIDQISQINVLNKTIEEIGKVKFPRPKGTSMITEIQNNIDKYEQQLASEDKFGREMYSSTKYIYGTEDYIHTTGKPRKEDLDRGIQNMDKELNVLNESIKNSNAEVKSLIQKQHADKQEEKKYVEKDLETSIDNYIDGLVENGPRIMCKSFLDSTTGLIKKEMNTGKIPNVPKRQMIDDLLARKMCLCHTPLDEDTDARKHVKDEMERISGEIQFDIASQIRNNNEKFLNNYDNIKSDLDDERLLIQNKREKLERISEDLQTLKRKLGTDNGNYAKLLVEKEDLQSQRDDYNKELGKVNQNIGDWTQKKGDEIRRLKVAEDNIRVLNEYILTSQQDVNIKEKLNEIKQDVDEIIRNKVACATLIIYNKMAWKKDYEHLMIDDKYQISIRGEDGMNIVGGMAAGEKLFLALSFIMALKKITNYKFPFVIDSPLGKAGGNLKISFGKYMPKLLDGSQMIMLATNTEYSKDKIQPGNGNLATHTLKELLEQSGAVYEHEINFNKETEIANIIDGRKF